MSSQEIPEASGSCGKLTAGQRWAYAVGNFANMTAGYGIVSLAPYVFNLALGVNPSLVGLALAVPRCIDLFTDPAAGYLSDRLLNRLGRRVFIGWGSFISAVLFALVWWFPNGLTERGYFHWLLFFSCATAFGWSLLSIPWQALGFELSKDYHERTLLMATSTMILGLAGIFYGWSYAATQLSIFHTTAQGARWIGSIMAASILAAGLVTVVFCRERRRSNGKEPRSAERKEDAGFRDFFATLVRVFKNRPFLRIASAIILLCIGVFSVSGIGPYIAIYFIERGNQAQGAILIGVSSTAWQGTCILLSGLVSRVSHALGKSRALILFLGIALVGNLFKWICYNPAMPWLFVIPSILFAAGFTGLWTLAPSMVADVCDYEKLNSGFRDDGMFAGFYTWMIKLGSTVAFAAGGFLINLTGFNVSKGAAQGAHTIFRMRLVDFSFPAVAIALSMWILWRYPLSEAVMKRVRAGLDAPGLGGLRPLAKR